MRGYRAWFRPDPVALSLGASAASTAVAQGLGLGRALALAWLLPPAEYGLFSVALLVINVLLPIGSLGLFEGIARYAPEHESRGTLARFARHSAAVMLCVSVTLMGALIVLAAYVGPLLFGDTASARATDADVLVLTRAAAGCTVSLAAYHGTLALLRALRMFRASSLMEGLGAVTTTALLLGLAGWSRQNAAGLIIAYTAANVLTTLLFLPGVRVATERAAEPRETTAAPAFGSPSSRGLLMYSISSAAGAVVWHAVFYYPAWVVLKRAGEETVAVFNATRTIAQLLLVAAVMASGVVSACVNHIWARGQRDAAIAALRLLTRVCAALLLVGACVLVLGWPLIGRLLPAAYSAGGGILPGLVLLFFLLAMARLAAVGAQLIERPRLALFAWSVGLTACVLAMGGIESSDAATVLAGATWASVGAAGAALAVIVGFLHGRGIRIDGRVVGLILASAAVLLPPLASGVALALLLLAGLVPGILLTRDERAAVRALLFSRERS